MKSKANLLFHCSIRTIEEIFQENSFARELCETKAQRIMSWEPDFEIIDSDHDSISVEYTTKGSGGTTCLLNFYKISNTVVKCHVEANFGWGIWITVIILCFLIGFFAKSDVALGGGMFVVMLMVFFWGIYYFGVNSLCARIKRRYEKNESFIKLYNQLLSLSIVSEISKKPMGGYFIHNSINQEGPYSVDELGDKVKKDTFVWKEGMTDWALAEEVEELMSLFVLSPSAFKAHDDKIRPPDFKRAKTPPVFNRNS